MKAQQEQRISSVLLADDHQLVTWGVRQALASLPEVQVCGEATDSTRVMELIEKLRPDMLVTDLNMPGGQHGDGLTLLGKLRRRYPDLSIIVLTMVRNPPLLVLVWQLGVQGLLLKNDGPDEIRKAVKWSLEGNRYLSRQVATLLEEARGNAGFTQHGALTGAALSEAEREILRMYVSGMTISEIAATIHRSVKTVSGQKMTGMRKLGVNTSKELFEYARQEGMLG